MKRKQLLYVTECNERRFDTLHMRDQLPFLKTRGRWAEYSVEEAFRLRVMLDLIGSEGQADPLGGLGHKAALSITNNALSKYHSLRGAIMLEEFAEADWWIGVTIFEEVNASGERLRYADWFIGPLQNLSSHQHAVIEKARKNGEPENIPVRTFVVNASRAARFVLDRAEKIGAEDAD